MVCPKCLPEIIFTHNTGNWYILGNDPPTPDPIDTAAGQVIQKQKKRRRDGKKEYGSRDLSNPALLSEAIEEALDLAVYLQAALNKIKENS
jgi:hypothetical protein